MLKKPQQPTQKEYIPSRYTQLSNIYSQTEFENIQRLLEHLTLCCTYNIKYPILKLLRAVCRCLLINELESIFFAYVIETNGWKIHDSIIKKYKQDVKDIVFYTTTDEDYKALTLYLLLCGYTAKFYLNECTDLYAAELEKICPDFKAVFNQWVKLEAHTTLKINPRSLNRVYKQIYLNSIHKPTSLNYNSLVDNILLICPSYNPERQKQHMEAVKQEKVQPKPPQQQPMNVSMTVANLPILSSSGFLQQIGILPFNNSMILTESIQNKRISFGLNSSQFGINNLAFVEEQNDINDFHLGFRQCQSDNEDNVSKVGMGEDPLKEQSRAHRGTPNTSSYFY